MKAKILDTKIVLPGEKLTIDLGLKCASDRYVVIRFYALPMPPKGSTLDDLDKLSSRVAKWLSSENLNI